MFCHYLLPFNTLLSKIPFGYKAKEKLLPEHEFVNNFYLHDSQFKEGKQVFMMN